MFDYVRNPPLGIQSTLNFGDISSIGQGGSLLSPSTFYANDPTSKIPTLYSYTFGVQTKLPFDMILDTAYVGSLSLHLQDNRNLYYMPYGTAFLPHYQDPTLNPNALLGNSVLPSQFLRGLQGISDINLYESTATGNYNSLQVTLDRHVWAGCLSACPTPVVARRTIIGQPRVLIRANEAGVALHGRQQHLEFRLAHQSESDQSLFEIGRDGEQY